MNLCSILCLTLLASFHNLANGDLKGVGKMEKIQGRSAIHANDLQEFVNQDSRLRNLIHDLNPSAKRAAKAYNVQLSSPLIKITRKEHGLPARFDNKKQLTSRLFIHFELRYIFSDSLYLGCSFHLQDATLLKKIRELAFVVNVQPVRTISLPKLPFRRALFEERAEHQKSKAEHRYAIHQKTGVKKLHNAGITGKRDTVVCVVDTGVDYTLEALGGCFGKGCKIIAGEDLVGEDYDGTKPPVRGGLPTDATGHGTHVCGIIAGESDNFIGVAPSVSLAVWKVFGKADTTSDDVIIEGILAAKEFGCNILSLSIGALSGWSGDILSTVVDQLVAQGVFVSAANGNEGLDGPFTGNSPGSALSSMTIGSVDSPGYWGFPATVKTGNSKKEFSIQYFTGTRFSLDEPLEFYATSLDLNEADACSPLADTTPDLSQKMVLIRRGNCSLGIKSSNAQKKGAKTVLYYNNDNPFPILMSTENFQVGIISASDGLRIFKALSKGQTLFFSQAHGPLPDSDLHYHKNNLTAYLVNSFSSLGPNYMLQVKPEIVAPGGNLLSSYPSVLGSYAVLSGTSMATPYLAGVAALFKSVHGTLNPYELKNILISTSTPVNFYDGVTLPPSPLLAPVSQQGGGLVEAYHAIKWSSRIEPAILHLNDSVNFQCTHTIKIHNHSKQRVMYTFSMEDAAGLYTFPSDSVFPQTAPLEVDSSFTVVKFSADSVAIPAKKFALVQLEFTPPTSFNISRFLLYSGYIKIVSTLEESFSLPFLGTTSDMNSIQILEISEEYPYITTDSNDSGNKMPENTHFKIGKDMPSIVFKLIMGTPILSIKLVSVNPAAANSLPDQHSVSGPEGVEIADSPIHYAYRSIGAAAIATWNGTLASGTTVIPGSYKILISALKIFGNATKDSDWVTWLSPAFVVEN